MEDKKLPISLHLKELRLRLLFSLASVVVFSLISFMCWPNIIDAIRLKDINLIFISPLEAFLTRIKAAVFCGILLSMPITLYQIWEYIKPALTKRERKLAIVLVTASSLLLYLGLCFSVCVVTPMIANFFLKSAQSALTPLISVSNYTSFFINMTMAFAIISQSPLLIVIAAMLGIISGETLSKYRKSTIIAIFILAAIITPPDALSQLLLALPMWALYELSLIFIRLFCKLD